jgi:hypothetical protein
MNLADGNSTAAIIGEKCPYAPLTLVFPVLPSVATATPIAVFTGITRRIAISPHTHALPRTLFDRARQKRGPPSHFA